MQTKAKFVCIGRILCVSVGGEREYVSMRIVKNVKIKHIQMNQKWSRNFLVVCLLYSARLLTIR